MQNLPTVLIHIPVNMKQFGCEIRQKYILDRNGKVYIPFFLFHIPSSGMLHLQALVYLKTCTEVNTMIQFQRSSIKITQEQEVQKAKLLWGSLGRGSTEESF